MGSKDEGKFYLTTAINYTNGMPHIGHCLEAVLADFIARYQRLYGKQVYFLTGTDEHGLKIAETARIIGVTPIEICDKYSKIFQLLADQLQVSYDFFIRTTMQLHKTTVLELFGKMLENGDIYLGDYEGWYNVREETYVSDHEAKRNEYKDPVTGKDLQRVKEKSYFFRLSRYEQRIKSYIEEHPEFIQPTSQRQQILGRLKENTPLRDLSISRTTFDWGIPIKVANDNQTKHCIYVWFEALINYYTATRRQGYQTFWPANLHIIGKDIVWFHTVIWPCMLMAAELELPKQIYSHNFVTAEDGQKMSKTLGNVVDIEQLLKEVPVTSFRYYLLRETNLDNDLRFSEKNLKLLHNTELADGLGNLSHRLLAMAKKYCHCDIPSCSVDPIFDLHELSDFIYQHLSEFRISEIIQKLLSLIHQVNQYINTKEPWAIGKGHDTRNETDRQVIIRTGLEALYLIVRFWEPIEPSVSHEVIRRLGQDVANLEPINCCTWLNLSGKIVTGAPLYKKFEF